MYQSISIPTIAMKNKERCMIALRTDEFIARGGEIQVIGKVKGAEVVTEVQKKSRAQSSRVKKLADARRFHV